jgi:hypothetical protein
MQVETQLLVYRNDDEDEIELTIVGDVEPFVAGNRRGHPDNWTPDEGGSCCVEAVLLDGKLWDGKLTKEEEKEAEEALQQAFIESCEPDPDSGYDDYIDDDRADYIYDPYGY